ncbi:CGNR zinc finger domain-containing protein [Streptomyces pratensis]|uniref:CGNR zinc finger domain-containing protein n=1 Tax=Streptomyces pratensis TaxID=1169025 RepID=UPI003015DD9E
MAKSVGDGRERPVTEELEPSAADELPLSGEPLPLDLVNTTYIRGGVRGRLVDAFAAGPQAVDVWLAARRGRFSPVLADRLSEAGPIDPARYREFLELRGALRSLAAARTSGEDPETGPLAVVNARARSAAHWPELVAGSGFRSVVRTAADDVGGAALGEIAAAAVDLFTGPAADRLRACPAPGCILYFVRTHARREWCTVGCGNRVRVARHSRRARAGGAAGEA